MKIFCAEKLLPFSGFTANFVRCIWVYMISYSCEITKAPSPLKTVYDSRRFKRTFLFKAHFSVSVLPVFRMLLVFTCFILWCRCQITAAICKNTSFA